MNYTKKEREYYNIQRDRTCERLSITKNQYNWLRRKSEELHKVYENNCNGLYEQEYDYIREARAKEGVIHKKALDLCLFDYFQTDPRGATLYLDKDPIPDNNYTNACCIY